MTGSSFAGDQGSATPPLEQAKQQAGKLAEQAQQKAGQVLDQTRTQVKGQLNTQIDNLAGSLGGVAEALRATGDQMQQKDLGAMGDYATSAAAWVDGCSSYFRDRDVDQVMGEVEGFARREPAIFLGAAFALGFMAVRFLKSSSRGAPSMTPAGEGYQRALPAAASFAAEPGLIQPAYGSAGMADADEYEESDELSGSRYAEARI